MDRFIGQRSSKRTQGNLKDNIRPHEQRQRLLVLVVSHTRHLILRARELPEKLPSMREMFIGDNHKLAVPANDLTLYQRTSAYRRCVPVAGH